MVTTCQGGGQVLFVCLPRSVMCTGDNNNQVGRRTPWCCPTPTFIDCLAGLLNCIAARRGACCGVVRAQIDAGCALNGDDAAGLHTEPAFTHLKTRRGLAHEVMLRQRTTPFTAPDLIDSLYIVYSFAPTRYAYCSLPVFSFVRKILL